MINKGSAILFFVLSALFANDFTFNELPIQEDGRIKPLDTYSRNQLLRFHGKKTIKLGDGQKLSAINWMKNIFIDTENEVSRKIFNIRNPEVAYSLGLDKNDNHRYSFLDIVNGFKENQSLLESLQNKADDQSTLVEQQIIEIYQNVILFDEISRAMFCFLPSINIKDKILIDYLGIPDGNTKVSYSFFMRNIDKFRVLLEDLLETDEQDWNQSHVELSSIAIHLQNLTQYHYAQSLKIIPSFENKDDDRWLSPWELMDGRPLNEQQVRMLIAYEELILGLVNNNVDLVNEKSKNIISVIEKYNNNFNGDLLATETSFNKLNIFLYSLIFYVISFLIIGISWMYSNRFTRKISFGVMILGFLMHGYGILLRMIIMQRPPVSTL